MTATNQPKRRGGARPGSGRPRVHDSAAARQAAYQQRQQQQAQAHAQALAVVATSAALTPDQQAAVQAAAHYLGGKHDI